MKYSEFYKASFPTYLGADIDLVLKNLSLEILPHMQEHQFVMNKVAVTVDNQQLHIPYRIYIEKISGINNNFSPTETQKLIIHCLLSRHYDGFTRENHLRDIITANVSWGVPYVFQILGEYVIELLQIIYKELDQLDMNIYLKFIEENSEFYEQTRARMISYWNCYYRRLYKYKKDYVGFKIFEYFDSQLKSRCQSPELIKLGG